MSRQLSAYVLLAFLVCTGQSARVSITNVLESDDALDKEEDLSSAKSCPKLHAKIQSLCDYIPAKVHKVDTKGISGWKGSQRIIVLGRKSNALAASIRVFEEKECEGDLTTAKEHLASVTTQIKKMASDGGEDTARLARAMSEAEAELAKPEGERDLGSIQAAFMRTLLGGDGDMTATEKNELLCEEGVCKTDKIIDDVLSEPDSDHLSANETETLKQQTSLIDMSTDKEVAASGNIFLSGLKGLARFVAVIVLAILGFAWWLVTAVSMIAGYGLGPFAAMAAGVICGMWWLLGQFVQFISFGGISFGKFGECFDTIWTTPFVDNADPVFHAMIDSNPWNYMHHVA